MKNKGMKKVNIVGKKVFDSYVNLDDPSENADGYDWIVRDGEYETVAELYESAIRGAIELIEYDWSKKVKHYGAYDLGGYGIDAGKCYYINYVETREEYGEEVEEERTELVMLYVHVDGDDMLISYSDDPITEASCYEPL